jgi:tRNA A-37 threonylcarbamoyl transferase component Bud32
MEELQDAIEDAQYVNAIATQEEGPRPVLSWEIPTQEQAAIWVIKIKKQASYDGPEPFGIDWTLECAIGLFLFSAFLKETCDEYPRINFIEDVIRWKKIRGKHRFERARAIYEVYLLQVDPHTGAKMSPPKSQIDEFDLIREVPTMDEDHIQALYESTIDPSKSENCLGLKGVVIDEIADAIRTDDLEQKKAANKSSSIPTEIEQIEPNGDSVQFTNAKRYESLRELTQSWREKKTTDPGLSKELFDEAEVVVVESLRRQYWQAFLESENYTKLLNFRWFRDRPVVPDDFFNMRVLGRGGFGSVVGKWIEEPQRLTWFVKERVCIMNKSHKCCAACKRGVSGKLYAMKVMDKKRIKLKKSEVLTVNERKALAAVESPFVVNLKYSFHSRDSIFLILDLMTGGDLGYHLHQKGKFPKRECQYYAARIMLGLQALHDQGYVYRDLKPENCLLAEDGRVKITDLGLTTKITPTLHGAAGTRGYWAPEMLRRNKKGKRMTYGHTVDWFSFGCCVAEFISGANPFRSEAALNFGLAAGKESKVRKWSQLFMTGVASTELTTCSNPTPS